MRVIVNFNFDFTRTYGIHCIAEDARTVVSGWTHVSDKAMLIKALRYAGATDEEIALVERDLSRWNFGGVHITLASERKNILKIKPQYASPLGLW
jgi:hypothetical protein